MKNARANFPGLRAFNDARAKVSFSLVTCGFALVYVCRWLVLRSVKLFERLVLRLRDSRMAEFRAC